MSMKVKHLVTVLQCLNRELEVDAVGSSLHVHTPREEGKIPTIVLSVDTENGKIDVQDGLLGMMIALTLATIYGVHMGQEGYDGP